ncbi:hypothetical protein D7Y15_08075 [Corallococcus sp. AB030]|uniref:hypothetical protein n=1 Tax=Corallococcus sp. AB030 TaxID=2316716 RepID=UPI000EDE2021|nr:hypothetical protein [Corallococcus sp. AB030]RKI18645.1 hypothetical protein D7Y15_08075 [Corallococcus sp. AB030]
MSKHTAVLLSLALSTTALAQEEAPADGGDFPAWSSIVATATAQGVLNPAAPGGNPRPLALGVGYGRWSERGAIQVLAHLAPSVAADGPDAAGGLLLRPGGRLGLSAAARLHRLGARSELPLTVGGYLRAGASLDSAAGASWTSLRADAGVAAHWWQVHTPMQLVLGTLEAGPVVRRRTGDASGTWLGLSVGASVTVQRVTAGLTLTHVLAGDALVPGLTGTHVTAGVTLQADLLPL